MVHTPTSALKPAVYNPRHWDTEALSQLKKSIKKFGIVDPLICNGAPNRKDVLIGGHMRLVAAKDLGLTDVPVVYVNIPDIEREKELNLRLNKNTGEWDWSLLAEFDEAFLVDVGFSSEDLDDIFPAEEHPEIFDLEKELQKLNIERIEIQKGDVWQLGEHRLMCGDSTVQDDILRLMNGEKTDMCFTDPPYILDYLRGKKRHGKATEGFGYKRDRRYLETDELPPDFTERWMANIQEVAGDDFHIMVFENWRNLRTIWDEIEKYWKVKNLVIWHLPNRTQGFAAKYKFFSKHDVSILGSSEPTPTLNIEPEEELLQSEYEAALYAISGSPHWEGYEKGKRICPTDFIEFRADDAKHSGQGVIFGCKPTEILIPYIKVLTKRGDLVVEPFGGSGSTLIAAERLKRRCYVMEKVPTYCEVIRNRWEKLTGLKATKL